MALIVCPECGGKVSDMAGTCIHCGFPLSNAKKEDYYLIEFNSSPGFAGRFHELFRLFPEADKEYFSRFKHSFPSYIGTGLTKENAEWLQEAFAKTKSETNIRPDSSCKEANTAVNKFIEEEREGKIHCPRCGAVTVSTGNRGFSMMTGFIGSSKVVNRCANCGNKWSPDY